MDSRLDAIARQARMSRATVSRVLNERSGVSERARRAVLTAMDVLGYERPQRLRPQSAGLVGLVVPSLEDPLHPLLAEVLGSNLSRQGYTPVLCVQAPDSPAEDEYVAMLRARRVAGIVLVAGPHTDPEADRARYQALVAQRLPIVLVNRHLTDVDAPSISCDHVAAGTLAVAHLAGLGHERIGLVTAKRGPGPADGQRAGYRAAMREHVPADSGTGELETTTFEGIEGGYAGARRLIDHGVTALVCGSDLLALGAIRAVRQTGRSVPGDVSVVGYDDSVLMAHTDPPLTTVRQPSLAMGRAATRMLLEEIRGDRAPRGESLFQPELVVRSSTARPGRPSGV